MKWSKNQATPTVAYYNNDCYIYHTIARIILKVNLVGINNNRTLTKSFKKFIK